MSQLLVPPVLGAPASVDLANDCPPEPDYPAVRRQLRRPRPPTRVQPASSLAPPAPAYAAGTGQPLSHPVCPVPSPAMSPSASRPLPPQSGGAALYGEGVTRSSPSEWPWCHPDIAWLQEAPELQPYLLHNVGESPGSRGAGLLPRGKVGVLAGAGGVGKSFATLDMGIAVVTGRPWLGYYPVGDDLHHHVVMLMGEEDPQELRRRFWALAQARSLTAADREMMRGLYLLPGAGLHDLALSQPEVRGQDSATDNVKRLLEHLEDEAVRAGRGYDLIVIDPLSRFAGADVETDNSAATRMVQILEKFTKLSGNPTVLVTHHTAKSARGANKHADGAVGVRGASALVDGPRWVANLDAVFTTERRLVRHATLTVSKTNNTAFPEQYLTLTRGEGGVLRPATDNEIAQIAAAQQREKRDGKSAGRRGKPSHQLPEGI